jgi:hypothetical protein
MLSEDFVFGLAMPAVSNYRAAKPIRKLTGGLNCFTGQPYFFGKSFLYFVVVSKTWFYNSVKNML